MVLGREDVARRPADLGAERDQRLDQHRGLDRHVQRADDARTAQRLRRAEFVAQRHQARHLGFGDADLGTAEAGERDIVDEIVVEGVDGCGGHLGGLLAANGQARDLPAGLRWQLAGQQPECKYKDVSILSPSHTELTRV